MEGKDFLELAKKLQNSGNEAERRTSVSRAYYAIFNYVKKFLHSSNIKLPASAEAHEKARQYLLNSGLEEAEDLAEDFHNLRERRNDADYEIISPKFQHDKYNCGLVCAKAVQFFERFSKMDCNNLLKGIWEYKRKTNN
jgi:uncharacterized protein (UPF0332 family)